MRMETDAFYLKSPEEMASSSPTLPDALSNTVRSPMRCDVELEFGRRAPAWIFPRA